MPKIASLTVLNKPFCFLSSWLSPLIEDIIPGLDSTLKNAKRRTRLDLFRRRSVNIFAFVTTQLSVLSEKHCFSCPNETNYNARKYPTDTVIMCSFGHFIRNVCTGYIPPPLQERRPWKTATLSLAPEKGGPVFFNQFCAISEGRKRSIPSYLAFSIIYYRRRYYP